MVIRRTNITYQRGGNFKSFKNNVGRLFQRIVNNSSVRNVLDDAKNIALQSGLSAATDVMSGNRNIEDILKKQAHIIKDKGLESIKREGRKFLSSKLNPTSLNTITSELDSSKNPIVKKASKTFFKRKAAPIGSTRIKRKRKNKLAF